MDKQTRLNLKGLSDFVKYLDENNNPIHNKVITVNKEDGDTPVDVALDMATHTMTIF